MALQTIALIANELKQTYDRALLMRARKDIVFETYGVKKPIPPRGGKSVEFRRFEAINVTEGSYTLLEGTPPLATSGSVSNVQATISQYGQWSELTDILNLQAFDPIAAEYAEAYGEAMAEGRDTVVRAELSNATTIQYADSATVVATSGAGAVGSGNYLDAAELLEAKRTLRRVNAKPATGNNFVCFIHPDNTKDLFEDADIVEAFQHAANRGGDNPLFTGVLGDWMGITFVETTNLKVHSSYGMSGADVYEVIVAGREAYGVTDLTAQAAKLYIQAAGGVSDPLEQKSTIGWKCAMAAKILNNDFLVLVNVASSKTPSA